MIINLEKLWYQQHPLRWVLWPFSQVYKFFVLARKFFLRHFFQKKFNIPIIVVGNLTVGGVGKTPLVIALARHLKSKGVRIGIVSRGYLSTVKRYPHEVLVTDDARQVGDEPWMIAKKTGCPVIISPKRVQAVNYLLQKFKPDIIISDDGLQHYKMGRTLEIVVIDGLRQFGNGFCLPAGPLREPISQLKKDSLIVINNGSRPNAYSMELKPQKLLNLKSLKPMSEQDLSQPMIAVAGIGHPERFFNTLNLLGISFKKYPFPDHHNFKLNELQFDEKIVVMTEKDAAKCQSFAKESWYFLPVEAELPESFWQALKSNNQLRGCFK